MSVFRNGGLEMGRSPSALLSAVHLLEIYYRTLFIRHWEALEHVIIHVRGHRQGESSGEVASMQPAVFTLCCANTLLVAWKVVVTLLLPDSLSLHSPSLL